MRNLELYIYKWMESQFNWITVLNFSSILLSQLPDLFLKVQLRFVEFETPTFSLWNFSGWNDSSMTMKSSTDRRILTASEAFFIHLKDRFLVPLWLMFRNEILLTAIIWSPSLILPVDSATPVGWRYEMKMPKTNFVLDC